MNGENKINEEEMKIMMKYEEIKIYSHWLWKIKLMKNL